VTKPLGKVSVYSYLKNAAQGLQLTGIANQASPLSPASSKAYSYGADAFVSSIIDENGNTETIPTHDPRGMPIKTVEASGTSVARTTSTTWDAAFREPDKVVQPTVKTTFTYNTFGAATSKTLTDETTFTTPYPTNGRTRKWTYTWNASNVHLTAVHGPLWVSGGTIDTTSFAYYTTGYVKTVTNALGQATTLNPLDWRGAPLTATDANGVQTTFTYDIHGRLLTAIVNPGTSQSEYQFAYDAVGDLTLVTLPMGATLQYAYDQGQRVTQVKNVRAETQNFTYDNNDDPLSLITRNGAGTQTQTHTAAYDEWGRILQSIGAASQIWNLAYDNLSNLLTVTDPPVSPHPANVRTSAFDALTRAVKQTDPETHFVQYAYDPSDNLNQLTDARSLVTNRVVDGFSEVIQETSPDRGTLTYYYDLGGNLLKLIDGGGVETDFAYDAANRRTTKTFPSDAAEAVTYAYDQTVGGNVGIGRLTNVTDVSGSTSLVYDTQGRIVSDSQVINGSGHTTPFVVAYGYDANGKVTQLTYPSGDVVNITRATDGLITAVTATPSGGAAGNIAAGVAYEPFGPLTALGYGNSLSLTRTYDQDYELTSIDLAPSSGPAVLNIGFGWQTDGRIAAVSDTATTNPRTASYTYTPSGRVLTGVGPWGSLAYAYDPSGNLTQIGTVTATISSTSNQLTNTTVAGVPQRNLGYVANGDLSQDRNVGVTTFSYSYNAANRLIEVQNTASPPKEFGAYAYDFAGRRVWRQTFGTSPAQTAYVHDSDGHVLAEENAATGAPNLEYIWLDDKLVGTIGFSTGSPVMRFVTTGQIDEPQMETAANQSLFWNGHTDPFGNAATFGPAISRLDLRLPGQWFQGEASTSGLHQNGWRDYDPSLGRYIEADPIGIDAGPNLYAYVDGDPLNNSDPRGLFLFPWETPFTIQGGSGAQQSAIQRALNRILRTRRGQQLLCQVNGPWWWHGNPITIHIIGGQNAYADTPGSDVYIDPSFHPEVDTTSGPTSAPTDRILGHEIGHAVTGTEDNGPGQMNNVIQNENPIATQLGEPARTHY